MKNFFLNIHLVYVGYLLAGVGQLALVSAFPEWYRRSGVYDISLVVLWVCCFGGLWRYKREVLNKIPKKWLLWSIPLWILLLSRFAIYFPTYDDFAFHLPVGDYAKDIWNPINFLPLDYASYVYPVAQIVYPYLLKLIGIRLSLLVNVFFLISWFVSLNLRIKSDEKNTAKRRWWDVIFLYIFFVPHLMATHVSFMVDFLTLILGLEMYYQMTSAKGNRTMGMVTGLLSMVIKQSAGIVLMPLFLYLTWQKRREIKLKWIVIFLSLILIFFLVSYTKTGNPIAFLYNNFFKSPLYALNNFKDTRWGPNGLIEVLLWPVVGQFTTRYGEGAVNIIAKCFFAAFSAVPYVLSWWLLLRKKKPIYVLFILSFLVWSLLMGYSRYLLVFLAVYWLWLINELKIESRISDKFKVWFLPIFAVLCFSSIQTDFGWRPGLKFLSDPFSRNYYFTQYVNGLNLLGKDRLKDMANSYGDLVGKNKTMLVYYRGPESFLSYLMSKSGIKVVTSLDSERYKSIVSSDKVDMEMREMLRSIEREESILLIGGKQWLNQKLIYWTKDRICTKLELDAGGWYFQSPYLYLDTVLYECVKSGGGEL